MYVIVLAGVVPPEGDPLYELTHGSPKALLEIGGKPMIQWILDALGSSSQVGRVVVIGLSEIEGLSCKKPHQFIPNQGGAEIMLKNPDALYVLCTSSDIPTIRPDILDWIVNTAGETEDDVYFNVISRKDMEERFSGSSRSYLRFRDGEVCNGDLVVPRFCINVAGHRPPGAR